MNELTYIFPLKLDGGQVMMVMTHEEVDEVIERYGLDDTQQS